MTPQEFLNQFGTLAEAEGGVPNLRELILELAVRGKHWFEEHPEGISAMSRWLSEATPPEHDARHAIDPERVADVWLRPRWRRRGDWDLIPGCAARPGANCSNPFGMNAGVTQQRIGGTV